MTLEEIKELREDGFSRSHAKFDELLAIAEWAFEARDKLKWISTDVNCAPANRVAKEVLSKAPEVMR